MKTLFILVPIVLLGIAFAGGLGKEGPFGPRVPSGNYATLTEQSPPPDQKTLQINTIPATLHTPGPSATPPTCTPSTKVAVDFLLDVSGSMSYPADPLDIVSSSKMEKLKTTVIAFANNFQASEDFVGIQAFESTARNILSVGPYDNIIFTQEINGLALGNLTNMSQGFTVAKTEIERVINSYRQHKWVLILVSDGVPTAGAPPENPDVVQPIKDLGVDIVTIAYGADADRNLLQRIASTKPGSTQKYYYNAPSGIELQNIFNEIKTVICR